MSFKNIKYASTISKPATAWETTGNGDDYAVVPPVPVPPTEEGDWVLVGPGTTLNRNGYHFVLWTWADWGSALKSATRSMLDPNLINLGQDEVDAEFTEAETDPSKPDIPAAQEGDHRCGVHSPSGYQCEFAAHDGITHYNKACGVFVTQMPTDAPSEESDVSSEG